MSFTQIKLDPDDNFLFAGHGHTITGNRGEVGFLVPVDGTPANTSTSIRWMIYSKCGIDKKAKHVLFIMASQWAACVSHAFVGFTCGDYLARKSLAHIF